MADNGSEILVQRWQDYLDQYLPTEQKVARSALAGIEPEHAAAMAGQQAGIAFNKNIAAGNRELASYGIRPATDTDLAATTELIRRAAIVGASNNARANARNTNLNRMAQVAAVGEGIPASAAGVMTSTQGQYDAIQMANSLGKQQFVNSMIGGGMDIGTLYMYGQSIKKQPQAQTWQNQSYSGISEAQAPVVDYNAPARWGGESALSLWNA